jgi:alkaline phosphatase D
MTGNDSRPISWLKGALKASQATWKIVAADMSLGLVVYDNWRTKTGSEAVANGDDGAPLGRELEIADLLAFIKREDIRNVHWITADVHYAATHRYDPNRAAFADFLPFYEFVSGPLCAGWFGPNALDRTFGPEVVFQKVPPAGRFDLAPSEGSCHFGHVKIDGRTGAMTVTHRDATGGGLHALNLAPS